MEAYKSILDAVPWREVGVTALQSFVVYWFAILGLKAVGRRVFGELGPEDVVLLLLLSEALNASLTSQQAGFWGGLTSAAVLFVTVWSVDRIGPLRRMLDGVPVVIYRHGVRDPAIMKRFQVDETDLEKVARTYGVGRPDELERVVLEGDGELTAVVKPEARGQGGKVERQPR